MKGLIYLRGIQRKIFIFSIGIRGQGNEACPAFGFWKLGTFGDPSYGENPIMRYIYLLGIP